MAKKPKKSGSPATRDNTVIHTIADVRAPFLEAAYINTIDGFTGDIPTKNIKELLAAGAFNSVDMAIPWRELQQALVDGEVSEEIVRGLTQSADAVSAQTNRAVKAATGVEPVLSFDSQNAQVRKFINVQVGELITSITSDSRKSVKQIVEAGRDRQTTVAEIAEEIKQVVGLRPDQTQSLNNFTARLIKEGRTKKDIKRLGKKFARKKLAERANVIARTEMMTAVNGGHDVGWQQAADAGYFDPDKAVVRWVTVRAPNARLCPTCESMQDIPRPFKGVWRVKMLYDTKSGPRASGRTKTVRIPNQTHPNCRCTMTLDLDTEERL